MWICMEEFGMEKALGNGGWEGGQKTSQPRMDTFVYVNC